MSLTSLQTLIELPKDSIWTIRAAFTIGILLRRDFQVDFRKLDEFQGRFIRKTLNFLQETAAPLRFIKEILSINSRLVASNPD